MWRETSQKVVKFTKVDLAFEFSDGKSKRLSDLAYHDTLDILEGYAYSKKGSDIALSRLLEQLTSQLAHPFTDVDEALLLANSIV